MALLRGLSTTIAVGRTLARYGTMSKSTWLEPLLVEHSTDRYYIHFNGVFSNHLSHGVTAMAMLGADSTSVQEHTESYKDTLEPASKYQPDAGPTYHSFSELPLGQHVHYYAIRKYMEGFIDSHHGNCEAAVLELFPKLSDGLAASLLHGLIHVAYGLVANCKLNVSEGLALWVLYYQPAYGGDPETHNSRTIGEFGKGSQDLLKVLELVSKDDDLKEKLKIAMAKPDIVALELGGMQGAIAGLFQYHNKTLQKYVDMVQLPDCLLENTMDVDMLTKWLIEVSFVIYTRTPHKNDFFLLHGVTAAWSLRKIMMLMDSTKCRQEILRACRSFFMTLLVVYVRRATPILEEAPVLESRADEAHWKQLIDEALSKTDRDAHYYKLVQVAHEMWQLDPHNGDMYCIAATQCLNNPLYLTLPTTA